MGGWFRTKAGICATALGMLLLAGAASVQASSGEGVFRGTVVKQAGRDPLPQGWILVQGNRSLRRVEVAHATILCPQKGVSSGAQKCGLNCLDGGEEVMVTASQDSSGEWRARQVEILRFAGREHCRQAAHAEGKRS
jgi:hypothetical protein